MERISMGSSEHWLESSETVGKSVRNCLVYGSNTWKVRAPASASDSLPFGTSHISSSNKVQFPDGDPSSKVFLMILQSPEVENIQDLHQLSRTALRENKLNTSSPNPIQRRSDLKPLTWSSNGDLWQRRQTVKACLLVEEYHELLSCSESMARIDSVLLLPKWMFDCSFISFDYTITSSYTASSQDTITTATLGLVQLTTASIPIILWLLWDCKHGQQSRPKSSTWTYHFRYRLTCSHVWTVRHAWYVSISTFRLWTCI